MLFKERGSLSSCRGRRLPFNLIKVSVLPSLPHIKGECGDILRPNLLAASLFFFYDVHVFRSLSVSP